MAERASWSAETLAGWADQLQAIARTGLFYATNDDDRDRYERLLAIAAEMAGALTGTSPIEIREAWRADVGYVTPKVGVGAAVFDEVGSLLLTQRPESGLWALPVGFAEVGETAASGAEREVREETGLIVRARRLLGVYYRPAAGNLHDLYNLFFWCVIEGGALTRTVEAPDLGYFRREALPPLVPHHQRAIADAFAMWHAGWQGHAFGSKAWGIDRGEARVTEPVPGDNFDDRVARGLGEYRTGGRHRAEYCAGTPQATFEEGLLMRGSPAKVVLDAGSGDERFTLAISPRFGRVVGVDTSDGVLAAARRRLSEQGGRNVRLEMRDATATGLPDASFEVDYSRRGPTSHGEFHRGDEGGVPLRRHLLPPAQRAGRQSGRLALPPPRLSALPWQ